MGEFSPTRTERKIYSDVRRRLNKNDAKNNRQADLFVNKTRVENAGSLTAL